MIATLCTRSSCFLQFQSGKVTSSGVLRAFSASQASQPPPPLLTTSTDNIPVISWYPGHIAKAEKELSEYLKKVDLVIEVRDARIPFSTTHPLVPQWLGNRPQIVAIVRMDQISGAALADWKLHFKSCASENKDLPPHFFVNSKNGAGFAKLKDHVLASGFSVNQRRMKRGIEPRAIRAAVIGFPNVGKSALINRLLGRKMAKSRNLPGVTRTLQWIRIGGAEGTASNALELLDSPGIIPARQLDQHNAVKLAICNDIGEASYDRGVVAAAMCDEINKMFKLKPNYVNMEVIRDRYKINFDELSGEDILYLVADKQYQGNLTSAADKLLGDFRKGMMGFGSLESPPLRDRSSPMHATDHIQRPKEAVNILDIGKGNYEGW